MLVATEGSETKSLATSLAVLTVKTRRTAVSLQSRKPSERKVTSGVVTDTYFEILGIGYALILYTIFML